MSQNACQLAWFLPLCCNPLSHCPSWHVVWNSLLWCHCRWQTKLPFGKDRGRLAKIYWETIILTFNGDMLPNWIPLPKLLGPPCLHTTMVYRPHRPHALMGGMGERQAPLPPTMDCVCFGDYSHCLCFSLVT